MSAIFVCVVYYTFGSIRISMMESQGSSEGLFDLSAFHFVVFNLSFFAAIFCTKYFILPSAQMMKNNAEYRAEETKLHESEKKYPHNKKEVEEAHVSREQTKKKVKADFKPRIDLAKSKIQEKVEEIESITQNYNTLLSRGTHFYKQINANSKTVIAKFFSVVNLYRNDNTSLDIPNLEDLENPFAQYRPIKTFSEIQTGEVEHTPKQYAHPESPVENQTEDQKDKSDPLVDDAEVDTSTQEKPQIGTPISEPSIPSDYQWNTSSNTVYSFTNPKS